MPATHIIDSTTRLIITTWEGDALDTDFIAAVKKYQNEIQSNPDYIDYNEMVDLSNVSNIKFTTEGIKSIGQIASATDQAGKDKKLALIVNSKLAYGLARMYEAYRSFSKKSKKVIRIFKNKEDALEWLNN